MIAARLIRLYAERTRQPGETADEARERARRELPTVARIAASERPLRLPKARAH